VIALVRSELLRFRSRRLVKALTIVALFGILLIVVIIAVKSHPGRPSEFSMLVARDFLEGTSTLFVIAGWLIGTSLVGAEWQAGTMTTLLTWEPRRFRVLMTKTLAAAIGVFVMMLALVLLFTGLMWLVAATRGSTVGLDASLLWYAVRLAALAAIGAVLALGLTTVTRNSAAALGIAFAYLLVVEGLIRGFLPGWRGWLLGDNFTEFLLDHGGLPGRSLTSSFAVLALWCLAFLSIATATFLARDVD
jgi:ABC-type transport system involved in multi-copper enzyme maturation permease subunit